MRFLAKVVRRLHAGNESTICLRAIQRAYPQGQHNQRRYQRFVAAWRCAQWSAPCADFAHSLRNGIGDRENLVCLLVQ